MATIPIFLSWSSRMAKTRVSRKNNGSRNSSRSSNSSRNSGKTRGLLSYLYTPVGQILSAANNVTRATTNTVQKVVHNTANGVNRIGRDVTGRADAALSSLVPNAVKRRFTMKQKHPKRKH